MKVYALIFAGGVGRRMHSNGMPKQFLNVYGKPIIVHTLLHFQKHKKIDYIFLVCVESHIELMKDLVDEYKITKIATIISGGETGQDSIFNGLKSIKESGSEEKDIVLIHDGVRPVINEDLITQNINSVRMYGSSISSTPATETICLVNTESSTVESILPRNDCMIAKAPQSFYVDDIYNAHLWARENKITDIIDSADLMSRHGHTLHFVPCSSKNIKITKPIDFYILKGIMSAEESLQIIGI